MLGTNAGLARRRAEPARRGLHPLLLALLCCGAGILGVLAPLLNASSSTALACGFGNTPTMYANTSPSILKPILSNTAASPRPIIGYFADNFLAGQPITFMEDLSNMLGAPPKSSLQWKWEFGDGSISHDLSPVHTYAKPGTYSVYSSIFDSGTWNDFDSSSITIVAALPTNPPVIVATSSAAATFSNAPITFDASGSHATDGSPVSYYWNFGFPTGQDQALTSAKESVTFPPATLGSKSVVTLVVTDRQGAKTVKYFSVQILAVKAQISVASTDVSAGETITFDASSSTTDPSAGGAITQYIWSFGDGSPIVKTTDPSEPHTFTKTGHFIVTVTAVDQQGFSNTATVTMSVTHDYTSLVLAILGGLTVVVVGFFAIRGQLRRNRLIRERAAAMQLARARAVQADRDRRTRARMRAVSPPPPTDRYDDRYDDRPPRGLRR